MLSELHIENFAIIDQLDVVFGDGLIAFTGETGAGKSIIIDAVEATLGGRSDATSVRAGAQRAAVEAVYQIPEYSRAEILAILEKEDLLDDPDNVTLGREIRLNGRSVARVNGRSVNASLLRSLGEHLIDIHGQSEHLSLLHVTQHTGLLDRYAILAEPAAPPADQLQTLLTGYHLAYTRLQNVRKEIEKIHQAERDSARRSDMLKYQIQEIESARLQSGEEEELRLERTRLANAEALASLAQEGLQLLDEGSPESPAITDLFGQVAHAISGLTRLDGSQVSLDEQAQSLAENLAELGRSLRDYLEGIEFNPRRLDQVEERLGLLQTLKRKYGDTIPAILEYAQQAQRELEIVATAGERLDQLQDEEITLLQQLGRVGAEVSNRRVHAAQTLQLAMENELGDLHMSGARFSVQIEQDEDPDGLELEDGRKVVMRPNGLERIEFMIAPNPGEGFKPLAKIASGGETSRLMLALKNVLAQADHIPTLVFDEIDQGIGGRVGMVVGEKLWSLAHKHQVLCITHLPQLAVFSSQHYHVQKVIQDGRTITAVERLQGEARLVELAQMLGEVSEGTLHSARELLKLAEKRTLGNG